MAQTWMGTSFKELMDSGHASHQGAGNDGPPQLHTPLAWRAMPGPELGAGPDTLESQHGQCPHFLPARAGLC